MRPDELILTVLAELPAREIRGKKRLQKLAFFMKQAGVDCEANFRLWDFGPFSSEIAKAADRLTALDKIEERTAPVGALNTFMTIYSIPRKDENAPDKLDPERKEFLQFLDAYSTIELEVAATVRYFETLGFSQPDAVEQTKDMKPTKTTKPVIEKSVEIISRLNGFAWNATNGYGTQYTT